MTAPDRSHRPADPRTTLAARYVRVMLTCWHCRHQADADLQSLIDGGRGDVRWCSCAGAAWPVIRRTTGAGSGGDRRLTDAAHAETGFSAATELTGGWISVGTDAVESVK